MSNVVLFGGGLQTLSLARGLKSYANNIYSVGDYKSVGKYSRSVDNFSSVTLDSLSVPQLVKIIDGFNADVIIPTEDEYAEWLSLNKDHIESKYKIKCATVDIHLFKKVINKSSLLEECEIAGVPYPKTVKIPSDFVSCLNENSIFPSLIKPDISNGSRGICLVKNKEEFLHKVPDIVGQYGSCSLQEFIGQQKHYYNCMTYRYADGTFGYSVVTKITRFYPINGGSSSFCTTIDNPHIVKICQKLLEHLGWIGFADFDILEKEDGDYRIIEINPRVPASLHAALASGIDFGQMIVDDLCGNPRRIMKYIPGEQLRFLGLDIAWFLSSPERFKTEPSWFKFFGKHLHYQEGGIKDFRAMIYSIWSGIKKQMNPSFRKSKSGMN